MTDNPNNVFVLMLERMKARADMNKQMGIIPSNGPSIEYDCPICQDREIVPIEKDGIVNDVVICECKARKAQKRLFRASGITDEQANFEIKDYKVTPENAKMLQAMKLYMDAEAWKKGEGFMLSGSVGVGKSMMSQIVANYLLKSGQAVIFVSTNSLMAELRVAQFTNGGIEFEQKIEMLINADVVIFDDIGKEKATEWVQTQYFRIIDGRYNKRKATGFTSNYSFDELADRFSEFGEAIVSRIVAMTRGYSVSIKARDFRLMLGRKDIEERA